MSVVLERYESTPATYCLVAEPVQSMKAEDAMLVDMQMNERLIPLWELTVNGVAMVPALPVGIRLKREDNLFLAENDALSIYGSGRTPEEAIRDFKDTASSFAAEYRGLSEDEVIGLGAVIRANFLRVFPV